MADDNGQAQALIRPVHADTKLHDPRIGIGHPDKVPNERGAYRLQPDALPDARAMHVNTALRVDRCAPARRPASAAATRCGMNVEPTASNQPVCQTPVTCM